MFAMFAVCSCVCLCRGVLCKELQRYFLHAVTTTWFLEMFPANLHSRMPQGMLTIIAEDSVAFMGLHMQM